MFETFLQLAFLLLFLVDIKVYLFCFSCRGKEVGIVMAPGGKRVGRREGGGEGTLCNFLCWLGSLGEKVVISVKNKKGLYDMYGYERVL